MNARSLTQLSSAMLLLAAGAFAAVSAQETVTAVPASSSEPADPPSEQAERDAAEPAVSEPVVSEAASTPGAARQGFRTMDRLELESTAITGNRELPKVLYIVPWKKADLGDLIGRPANSLLDEVLTPVDRDVFRRQTQYYSRLEGAAAGAAAEPGKQEQEQKQPQSQPR
ncbi:MAG: hypothetical protein HC872_03455 [Gammaproteobacteria bacterium]|nr:hypothetical protein [Gammaproteobacteria bacterium]